MIRDTFEVLLLEGFFFFLLLFKANIARSNTQPGFDFLYSSSVFLSSFTHLIFSP